MPARPLSDQTLHLIHALRESLEQALEGKTLGLQERTLFGSYSSVSLGFIPAAGSSSSSSFGFVASARAISSLRCLP